MKPSYRNWNHQKPTSHLTSKCDFSTVKENNQSRIRTEKIVALKIYYYFRNGTRHTTPPPNPHQASLPRIHNCGRQEDCIHSHTSKFIHTPAQPTPAHSFTHQHNPPQHIHSHSSTTHFSTFIHTPAHSFTHKHNPHQHIHSHTSTTHNRTFIHTAVQPTTTQSFTHQHNPQQHIHSHNSTIHPSTFIHITALPTLAH
jgi:hypothetical protein